MEQGSWAFPQAHIMGPFRHLLKPCNKFEWIEDLNVVFLASKKEIVRQISIGVQNFNPEPTTCLVTDYSGVVIGFFLLKKHCRCPGVSPTCCKIGWKVCLVGFCFLHDAETRYSPIEGECLKVAYGLHQTHFYTLGSPHLVVATNHKPFLCILNNRSLPDIGNRRLLNLKEKPLASGLR